jgi:hypothetical protein
MRLLWAERAEAELGGLLRRGAEADAAYLRAALAFRETPLRNRREADRRILAPARRACGMASNDAEEALDRVLQEPHFTPLGSRSHDALAEQALTFTTYLRRLTQSITTLAPLGPDTPQTRHRLEALATRMERIAKPTATPQETREPQDRPVLVDVAEEQLQRMERQTRVLERTAATLPPPTA